VKEITGTEIMKMDLSAWVDDRVVADANRRWVGLGMREKTKEDWERIAMPLTGRWDSKLCLRMAIIAIVPATVLRMSKILTYP